MFDSYCLPNTPYPDLYSEDLSKPSVDQIAEYVSARFGMSAQTLRKKVRERRIVQPRHITMLIAWEAGHSLQRIKEYFSCDHTTVMHGRDTIRQICEVDAHMRMEVLRLADSCGVRVGKFVQKSRRIDTEHA